MTGDERRETEPRLALRAQRWSAFAAIAPLGSARAAK
jgi:hypothetical protein